MPFLRGARPSQAGQASGRHTGHPAHVMTLIEGAALPAGPPHPRSARHSSGRGSSPGSCALCNPVFLFAGAALTCADLHAMQPPRNAASTQCSLHAMQPPRNAASTQCSLHAMQPPRNAASTQCSLHASR
uniref:Uncharacterized protein n=1 Tax=Knipowitschia caucasica TaxID=637954 RepID=A0AAV2LP71_KNICA